MLARDLQPPRSLTGDAILTCGAGKYWPGIVVMVRLLPRLVVACRCKCGTTAQSGTSWTIRQASRYTRSMSMAGNTLGG